MTSNYRFWQSLYPLVFTIDCLNFTAWIFVTRALALCERFPLCVRAWTWPRDAIWIPQGQILQCRLQWLEQRILPSSSSWTVTCGNWCADVFCPLLWVWPYVSVKLCVCVPLRAWTMCLPLRVCCWFSLCKFSLVFGSRLPPLLEHDYSYKNRLMFYTYYTYKNRLMFITYYTYKNRLMFITYYTYKNRLMFITCTLCKNDSNAHQCVSFVGMIPAQFTLTFVRIISCLG
jgi:hypothetical protein